MLITQSFKYPFRRVSLLLWNQLICLKGLINNPGKRIQLRASYRLAAPVSGRKKKTPTSWRWCVDQLQIPAPLPGCSYRQLKLHDVPDRTNPRSSSPPSENRKHNTDGVLLRPTRHSGRFSEGLLHRRSQERGTWVVTFFLRHPKSVQSAFTKKSTFSSAVFGMHTFDLSAYTVSGKRGVCSLAR